MRSWAGSGPTRSSVGLPGCEYTIDQNTESDGRLPTHWALRPTARNPKAGGPRNCPRPGRNGERASLHAIPVQGLYVHPVNMTAPGRARSTPFVRMTTGWSRVELLGRIWPNLPANWAGWRPASSAAPAPTRPNPPCPGAKPTHDRIRPGRPATSSRWRAAGDERPATSGRRRGAGDDGRGHPARSYSVFSKIWRSSGMGGDPCDMTDSRCAR